MKRIPDINRLAKKFMQRRARLQDVVVLYQVRSFAAAWMYVCLCVCVRFVPVPSLLGWRAYTSMCVYVVVSVRLLSVCPRCLRPWRRTRASTQHCSNESTSVLLFVCLSPPPTLVHRHNSTHWRCLSVRRFVAPLRQAIADCANLESMVEATVDLSLIDQHEYMINPQFGPELQQLRDQQDAARTHSAAAPKGMAGTCVWRIWCIVLLLAVVIASACVLGFNDLCVFVCTCVCACVRRFAASSVWTRQAEVGTEQTIRLFVPYYTQGTFRWLPPSVVFLDSLSVSSCLFSHIILFASNLRFAL